MPDAPRVVMTSDIRRMKAMAGDGATDPEIAAALGLSVTTVWRHLRGEMRARRRMAEQYHRFVAMASTYVPTFGGGR